MAEPHAGPEAATDPATDAPREGEPETLRPGDEPPAAASVPPARPAPARPAPARPAPAWRRRAARLKRRVLDRLAMARRGLLPRVTVGAAAWDAVRVSQLRGAVARVYRLDDPDAHHTCSPHTLAVGLPDPAALVRLTASGLLRGHTRRLTVRLDTVPDWLLSGVRLPRVGADTAEFSWRRLGRGAALAITWTRPHELHRALEDALTAVLRARYWDQTGGPIFTLDRAAWVDGASSWPQGRVAGQAVRGEPDEQGRPLGPFQAVHPRGAVAAQPVVTAVANPYGRVLSGAAKPYRLVDEAGRLVLRRASGGAVMGFDRSRSPEQVLLRHRFAKYAVVTVDARLGDDPFQRHVLRLLAACGVVFAAPDPATRGALQALGLVTADDPARVADLHGYGLSAEATRRVSFGSDAALRRTAIAGDGALPLPAVTAVVSSMRADDIETCLGYLAAQTYPELEVVVGAHGYAVPPERLARWEAMLPRLRVLPFPAELPLGVVLGRLSRVADGELVTKVDDDDHYGPHHVTDLVLAWHSSGADLVAKGARFVHLPELGRTIDRAWAAPETFNVTPAGGTMLLSRGTLQQVGGWSPSSRHVDSDLIARIRAAGGVTYRTHGLEYVYVRRVGGHTWSATVEHLMEQGQQVYDGMPAALLRPLGSE